MNVALIYPPACDPTAPYLAVPLLTAVLREHGIPVLPIDANVEVFDILLRRESLAGMAGKIQARRRRFDRKSELSHTEQLQYLQLSEALPDCDWVPAHISDAVTVLRDRSGSRFYDPVQYEKAVGTVQSALRLISAAHSPLRMDFTAYRTPLAMLSEAQITLDARPEATPFYDYFSGALCDKLVAAGTRIVGISLAFPGQILPGFILAHILKKRLPGVHITVGGPAATQLMGRFPPVILAAMRGPFDSVILYEGERALVDLVHTIDSGRTPEPVIHGTRDINPDIVPAPDFAGLPLDSYFSPEPVLPYDPTRGCYWGRCAFCHYGLSERGTAGYRQRSAATVATHLADMSEKYGSRVFYFSQDAFAPVFARQVAAAIRARNLIIRWGTDMRPEASLTPACCDELRGGGALSVALGIESAAPRVIRLIDKGVDRETMTSAVKNLAAADIAVEAMCFTDFPTERRQDAEATLAWIEELRENIALFICGRFGLSHGSRVATEPESFGIDEVWTLQKDLWQTGIFYRERHEPKTDRDREHLDRNVDRLSACWWLHDYPWAGALSTAHTLLYYAHGGADVFQRLAGSHRRVRWPHRKPVSPGSFPLDLLAETACTNEEAIWHQLVHERRAVSPELYLARAGALPFFPANRPFAKTMKKRKQGRKRKG